MKTKNLILITLIISLGTPASLFAAEKPLTVSATFSLSKSRGKETFFELMSKRGGIKAALDVDYASPFQMISTDEFNTVSSNFNEIENFKKKLKGGEKGLNKLVESLQGKDLKMDKMYGYTMAALKSVVSPTVKNPSRLAGALAPVLALASGKGVLVQLDSKNYCYNVGYAKGSGGKDKEQDAQDRKTGRSYGASIERNAYDPSDNDYLRELSIYVSSASDRELSNFYTTLFQILLKSDASGLKSLSKLGQTVMTDFIAVYMAELDRHLMTGLRMYEWENALTEITMLAAYSATDSGKTFDPSGSKDNSAGRTVIESSEVKASDRMLGFFGVGTDGTGLDGRNKQRRHALTKQIVDQTRKIDKKLVSKIEKLIGAKPGVDIYDEVMEFINNYDTQDQVKENADEMIESVVQFILETKNSASAISAETL